MVSRPSIVETYNKFMGGVDLLDMLSALYKFNFRSRRWYMYIWWHTVTVTVVNAWNLYIRDQRKFEPGQKCMPLRRFQAATAAVPHSQAQERERSKVEDHYPSNTSPTQKANLSCTP